jgi:uncharacterized protein YxjI
MYPPFQSDYFLLKRQALALTGVFRIYDGSGQLIAYSKQKMFKLREDIRVYTDESQTREVLIIKARQILDFAAAYDVIDSNSGTLVGTLRRRGFRSIVRDEWEVLDPSGQPIGKLHEDNMALALLRRLVLGAWLPQDYDLLMNEQKAMDLRQRFNIFRYELEMWFLLPQIDHRLGLAAGILLAAIEGKQSD